MSKLKINFMDPDHIMLMTVAGSLMNVNHLCSLEHLLVSSSTRPERQNAAMMIDILLASAVGTATTARG